MAYVTKFNYKQIARSYFVTKNFSSKRELFDKPIPVFNLLEKNSLLLHQMLLESKGNIAQYPESVDIEFKRQLPKYAAYHFYKNCKNLNADYIEIKNTNGTEEIVDGTGRKNSGVFDWDLKKELPFYEKQVNDLLVAIEDIAKSDSLTRSYARKTFLLSGNAEKLTQEGLDDAAIKKLKEFEYKLKLPLSQALIDCYEAKYNPEIDFEEMYLQSLGFKKCSECEHKKMMENAPSAKEIAEQAVKALYRT